MKKIILFILIINLFLIQSVIGKTTKIAKVMLIKNGKAYFKLKTGKRYKELKISQKLKNDSIVKSERSTVKLKLLSGALIELKPGSKILLNKDLMKRSSVSLSTAGQSSALKSYYVQKGILMYILQLQLQVSVVRNMKLV